MSARLNATSVRGVWRGAALPGEVVYIPMNAPHQVRNAPDEPTIAVSMNYVDGGNLEAARRRHWAAPPTTRSGSRASRFRKGRAGVAGAVVRAARIALASDGRRVGD